MESRVCHQHYDPGVPPSLDYPPQPVDYFLREAAQKFPDKTALIFGGMAPLLGEQHSTMSYRLLDSLADRFAVGLQQMGFQKGDRLAIYMPNCPQFVIAYYGALRAGGIVVPTNPLYVAREIEHQLNDSGATFAVVLSLLYGNVREVQGHTPLRHVIVTNIKEYFPGLLKSLFTVAKEKKDGHRVDLSGETNTSWFQDFLGPASVSPRPVEVTPEDTAVLMYTGGTTGLSKGAQLSHHNILANAWQGKHWIDATDQAERTLTALPLFHSYGMTVCMNSSIVSAGTMILVPDPRDVKDIVKTIAKERPTMYPGVPALYNAINNYPEVEKYDLSSIRVCSSGAAPLPPEVQQQFQALTGARLAEGYGLSEASPVTHGNPAFGDNRIGTVGLPWPDTEVKIVDTEGGETLQPVGQEGELCIRGPQVMLGYWRKPTETKNTLRSDDDGGGPWLYTGDIAAMDEDGYFRIIDRMKDMILGAGGYNIYPREIEDVLYEHPKVLEAAAVGVPVPGKGERAKIFVVLKPDQQASPEELLDFCRENLAPYKVPSFVEFRDELPKTNVGKVLRRKLLEEEGQQEDS